MENMKSLVALVEDLVKLYINYIYIQIVLQNIFLELFMVDYLKLIIVQFLIMHLQKF